MISAPIKRPDPSAISVSDALDTIPARVAIEILDGLHFSSDAALRLWAINESLIRRQELDRRISADATLLAQRKQVARHHIAALRKIVGA